MSAKKQPPVKTAASILLHQRDIFGKILQNVAVLIFLQIQWPLGEDDRVPAMVRQEMALLKAKPLALLKGIPVVVGE